MKFRFLPTDEGFFELFDQAATNAVACAQRLAEVLADPADAQAHDRVRDCERAGDETTQTLLTRLNTSFVTPFDREDIHALAEEFDDVVDDMLAVSERLELLRVTTTIPELRAQADILIRATEAAAKLTAKLPSMKGVQADLDAIDAIESEGDRAYHEAIAHLFSGEFEALDVLRYKDLVEAMEAAINTVEDISDIVESIVLKHA